MEYMRLKYIMVFIITSNFLRRIRYLDERVQRYCSSCLCVLDIKPNVLMYSRTVLR